MVQLQQALSQRFGFLPAVSFEELLSFASRLKPRFGLLAVEQRWSVTLGYPLSEIKLRQKEHHRNTTFADDLFEHVALVHGKIEPGKPTLVRMHQVDFAADLLGHFYLDLRDPRFTAPFAVFHQRFSTNTLPTWERAQPFRTLCHNGEINAIAGNINRMRARSVLGTEEASRLTDVLASSRWGLGAGREATADAATRALTLIADHGLPAVLAVVDAAARRSRADATVTEEELKQFALANVPAYQHPRRVFFLDRLPLSGTNKIDRDRLRQWVADGTTFFPH